mgnify:CR=1 FL=1
MEGIKWTSFVVLTTLLTLVIQLLIINPVMAQDSNTTLAQNSNNTKLIVDLKNHTITTIDTTTNETISVKKFMPIEVANTTTNESLTTNIENATIDEILTPEMETVNETLTTNQAGNATTNGNLTPEMETVNETLTTNEAENATTNINLTDKFDALQGK